ncbi:MAG: FAD-dependent oxidoreductase [Candidatus Cloacimonetes bacterium]|nr:FAD-dependent oxidoreductase [Candidatus Cloacimonadota bacterium]
MAVIGAGPGGLSAAYYLITSGYEVTIFEGKSKAGGMMRYGIPEYRLPYDILDLEIQYIESLGVNIQYNKKIVTSADFMNIYENFDSVFFSTGLFISYTMDITGEDLPNVISGLEFLERVSNKDIPEIGKKVAVIGGGNTAMDAARTARRLGAEVEIYYRRRIEDMPADKEEIEEALEENVVFHPQTTPLEIKKEDSRIKFFWGKNEMKDEEGKRPKPVLIKGKHYTTILDTLIVAIGQDADNSFLPRELYDKLDISRGKIQVDEFGKTAVDKLFAGGDVSNNTADAISAIADGYRAAKGIDNYLMKKGESHDS